MSDRRPTLIITRGLQGSLKTTRAETWVAKDPTRRARVSRDDLRAQLHKNVWKGEDTERQIIAARDAMIRALLGKGIDVVCDETALPQRTARDLARLAALAGADFEVWDMTDAPLEECIARDAARTGKEHIGEEVIRDLHRRYLKGKPYPLPLPTLDDAADVAGSVPYVPKPGTPPAVMVDLDGTVAKMVSRSPYDETRVGEDLPNQPVIDAVCAMWLAGNEVIFCSGRTETCREATEKWLQEHIDLPYAALHMRAAGDGRKDSVVKLELFDEHIRNNWRVVCVFDDRDQVVDAWRSIGLTVLQVAPGNF